MRAHHSLNAIRQILGAAAILIVSAASPAAAAPAQSAVADAAMKGDTAALRALVAQKADVNAPQVDGATALHWAVYRDEGEAADLLIAAGAKVDAKNRVGVTPTRFFASIFAPALIRRSAASPSSR